MAQMQIDTQDIVIQHVAGVDVEFALSWDFDTSYMEKPVDLDAQVVVFDGSGTIVDAAFYNQLKACNGSICHSGDNRTGEGDGDDEVITVDFDTLPACVCALAVVVAAYSGGTFAAVESAACQIRAAADSNDAATAAGSGKAVLGEISVGCQGAHTALLLAVLCRDDGAGGWRLRRLGRPIADGRHFQDCAEALRAAVAEGGGLAGARPAETRALGGGGGGDRAFVMVKGDVAELAGGGGDLRELRLGLGWTTPRQDLDLDASCVMLGADGRAVGDWVVYFGQQALPGVQHGGDNLTGEGEGDDETIVVTPANVPPHIHHLAFVVNIYSEGRNFTEVFNSYARLVGAGGRELCRYPLDATITSRGLLLAALSRTEKGGGPAAAGGRWRFRAVGTMVDGRRARDADCLEDVAAVMAGKPAAVAPLVGEGALMYNPTRAPPPAAAAEAAEQQAAGKSSGCNCAVS